MPPELVAAAAAADVLVQAEGVSISETVDRLVMPGAKVRHGVRLLAGWRGYYAR